MLTALTTFFASLKSKVVLWALAAGALITGVLAIYGQAYSAGKTAQKLREADNTLKEVKENARIQAEHDSLSASDARKRLLDKWGQR